MIELQIIKTLIELTTSLLPLEKYFSKSERKKEISEWLYKLGNNIKQLSHFLHNNQFPATTCERIQIAYEDIHEVIGDVIPKKKEANIKALIGDCLNIEKIYYEYMRLDEYDKINCIQELDSIAGSILGMADTLKYQK